LRCYYKNDEVPGSRDEDASLEKCPYCLLVSATNKEDKILIKYPFSKQRDHIEPLQNELRIYREIYDIMKNVKGIHKLIGYIEDKQDMWGLVYEYCSDTLKLLLSKEQIARKYKIDILYQIAQAMAALHKIGFAYLAVNCSNVFLKKDKDDNKWSVRLANFAQCEKRGNFSKDIKDFGELILLVLTNEPLSKLLLNQDITNGIKQIILKCIENSTKTTFEDIVNNLQQFV